MRQISKVNLSRDEYKKLKKYNKQQLEQFLSALYTRAYDEGTEETEKRTSYKLRDDFLDALKKGECKGIGEKTAEKIAEFVKLWKEGKPVNA